MLSLLLVYLLVALMTFVNLIAFYSYRGLPFGMAVVSGAIKSIGWPVVFVGRVWSYTKRVRG